MRDRPSFQTYYALIDRSIGQYLDKQDATYLLNVDKEEHLDFLVEQSRWEPLEWDETGMTVEPFTAKVQRRDDFERNRTYTTDAQRLRIRIPVTPHPQRQEYLDTLPSTYRLNREPEYKFSGNLLILEVDASEQAVKEVLDDIRFWLGGRNKDIEQGNATLKERIRPIWEARRKRLEEGAGNSQSLLAKLNIPLHQDPNARAKPIDITPREVRTVVARPVARTAPTPALNLDDVHALVQFIDTPIPASLKRHPRDTLSWARKACVTF